ncbi:MAG: DUF429 domain-containing protein [Nitrospinota bacterium]|jgi:predicted nuclease with RNAse H fold|nr:DUF429 domain-containing protein [Nitrospinota bacterium]
MRSRNNIWIGADPGGKGKFGLAILKSDGSAQTCCVDCADEALDKVTNLVKAQPAGIGVDAPLWWSSGRSSARMADQWLRGEYGLSGGEVQAVNSLRGAALVQGMMFVDRIRRLFPDVGVTETHPKAVMAALKLKKGDTFFKKFSVKVEMKDKQEHERDAIISAVAAREGFEKRWVNDLSSIRHESEQDPSQYWLAPVHYFWPHK